MLSFSLNLSVRRGAILESRTNTIQTFKIFFLFRVKEIYIYNIQRFFSRFLFAVIHYTFYYRVKYSVFYATLNCLAMTKNTISTSNINLTKLRK